MKTPEESREQLDCGRSIRKARKEKGWTQAQLADAIGVKRAVVSKYENGLVELSTSKLSRIKEALGIEFNERKLSLNTLRDAIYEDAVAHGLLESTDYTVKECIEEARQEGEPADQEEMMRGWAMEIIRREVNELEYARADAEAYAEELADVIIASLSVAGKMGIDIDAAVRSKMEINKSRPWKHGEEGDV